MASKSDVNQPERTSSGPGCLALGIASVGVVALALAGFILLADTSTVEAATWKAKQLLRLDSPIERDQRRLHAFKGDRDAVGSGDLAPREVAQLVSDANLSETRDSYAGPYDRFFRSPEALAREWVIRIARPCDFELVVAELQARAVRSDADACLKLIDSLESTEALAVLGEALWSQDAIRSLQTPHSQSQLAIRAAREWGESACHAIENLDEAAAVAELESSARAICNREIATACKEVRSLRDLVSGLSLSGQTSIPPNSDDARATRQRLMSRAQAGAILLSSLAEAREAAIKAIRQVCHRVTEARVGTYLESMTGPFDSAVATYKILTTSEREFVSGQLEMHVLQPAGVLQLPESVQRLHASAIRAIPNRIADECERELSLCGAATSRPDEHSVISFDGLDELSIRERVSLFAEPASVLDLALAAAIGLELVPEPTGATKAAGLVLAVGSGAWQTWQFVDRAHDRSRRAEQCALIQAAVARTWVGAAACSDDACLPDGTIIDRKHGAIPGALSIAEERVLAYFDAEVKRGLQP